MLTVNSHVILYTTEQFIVEQCFLCYTTVFCCRSASATKGKLSRYMSASFHCHTMGLLNFTLPETVYPSLSVLAIHLYTAIHSSWLFCTTYASGGALACKALAVSTPRRGASSSNLTPKHSVITNRAMFSIFVENCGRHWTQARVVACSSRGTAAHLSPAPACSGTCDLQSHDWWQRTIIHVAWHRHRVSVPTTTHHTPPHTSRCTRRRHCGQAVLPQSSATI